MCVCVCVCVQKKRERERDKSNVKRTLLTRREYNVKSTLLGRYISKLSLPTSCALLWNEKHLLQTPSQFTHVKTRYHQYLQHIQKQHLGTPSHLLYRSRNTYGHSQWWKVNFALLKIKEWSIPPSYLSLNHPNWINIYAETNKKE